MLTDFAVPSRLFGGPGPVRNASCKRAHVSGMSAVSRIFRFQFRNVIPRSSPIDDPPPSYRTNRPPYQTYSVSARLQLKSTRGKPVTSELYISNRWKTRRFRISNIVKTLYINFLYSLPWVGTRVGRSRKLCTRRKTRPLSILKRTIFHPRVHYRSSAMLS